MVCFIVWPVSCDWFVSMCGCVSCAWFQCVALFLVRVGNFLADVLISLISLSNQGIEIEPNISPVPARNGSKFRHRILHKVHKHKQWTTQQQTSNGPRSNKPTSNEPTSGTSKLKLQLETTSTTTPPASRATPRPFRLERRSRASSYAACSAYCSLLLLLHHRRGG